MEENLNGLESNIITMDDQNQILNGINILESKIFSSKSLDLEVDKSPSVLFRDFISDLESRVKLPSDQKQRLEYFSKVKNYIQSLPKIRVQLAFEPSQDFVKKIAKIVRESNQSLILEIDVDPKILAGVALDYKGKYGDYSFAPRLETALKSIQRKI